MGVRVCVDVLWSATSEEEHRLRERERQPGRIERWERDLGRRGRSQETGRNSRRSFRVRNVAGA